MAKVVTIINFKGGVGKSTISIELCTALARFYGKRTLLIDLDPQASATFYVMEQKRWVDWKDSNGTSVDLFAQQSNHFPIRKTIVKEVLQNRATVFGFDLLPSNPDLIDVDLRLTDSLGYTFLQRAIEPIHHVYDYIICDCPPNFNPVTKNALWASDAYIVPTLPDFLSTYGIPLLQRSVQKFFATTNSTTTFTSPVLGGIVLTRVRVTKLHTYYCNQVMFDYHRHVFKQSISDSIVIASAADEHMPISALTSPKGHTVELQQQFYNLAGEFISRMNNLHSQYVPDMSMPSYYRRQKGAS